ncbi:hypothetical protein [Salinarimonas sp.]|uniref:hypothetical protein n=1 Tax=Salinarimonas sp. TaxID=2766526 RepID=UPI003919C8F1
MTRPVSDPARTLRDLREEVAALARESRLRRASGGRRRERLHALLVRHGEAGSAEPVEPADFEIAARLERLHRAERLAARPLAALRRGYAITAAGPLALLAVGLLTQGGAQIESVAIVVGGVALWDVATGPLRATASRLRRARAEAGARIARLVEEAVALGREHLYAVLPGAGGAPLASAIAYRAILAARYEPTDGAVSLVGLDGREIVRLEAVDRAACAEIARRIAAAKELSGRAA